MTTSYSQLRPSKEQKQFIEISKAGENVLVDACIGSGKTTAIQKLCESLPSSKQILYLTYNRLLKLDAQSKIHKYNVLVQNYHGFAYQILARQGIYPGISDLIQTFLNEQPLVPHYDVLILDEYQDIEQEIAGMLDIIKAQNPNLQIIAVGDMQQKIYDKTTLDVRQYIHQFLDDYTQLEFTQCFRLSDPLASRLGRIWGKTIKGVNPDCQVTMMSDADVTSFLAKQKPEDIMCLGARTGKMSKTLNRLENTYPQKFNKNTVYASISDHRGSVKPGAHTAIFTTFDSSKGLERDICVVFDWNPAYWAMRLHRPQQKYEILRNIFLVAASRGKCQIIFVGDSTDLLDDETLMTPSDQNSQYQDCSISSLFTFKYREDVEAAYQYLNVKSISNLDDCDVIDIKSTDGLIDLSPCISVYQLANYFADYDVDQEIRLSRQQQYHDNTMTHREQLMSLDNKILLLTSLQTHQWRYKNQVQTPFVEQHDRDTLIERLNTRLTPKMKSQYAISLPFFDSSGKALFVAEGYADTVIDDTVYNLCYTSALQHEDFLECACEMIGLNLSKGIVWNTRNNQVYQITISDKQLFMNAVTQCATKRQLSTFVFD